MCHLLTDRPGRPFLFSNRLEKYLMEDVKILLPVKFRFNSVKRFDRRSRQMSQPIRGRGGNLVFPIDPKNANLVEGIEILLSVKFRCIPFSGFIEVEMSERPSCFSDRPEKHNVMWQMTLRSCFLSSFVEFCSAVPGFREVENVLANQMPDGCVVFRSARKTQIW